jgi:uncharacterized glyoxalase superfamily protein PhnB
MTTTRLFRVILPVGDIELAAEAYGELLGTPGERVSPGRHYFRCGDVVLACYDSAADGDGACQPCRYQANQFIYFSVPNLEATHEAAARLGFRIRDDGIATMPWGERMFWADDPFGNPVSFVEAGTEFMGDS